MKLVDKNSSIPLHTQLTNIIRKMINSGELKEGDSIVAERELCAMQNVSRMTVNKAIMGLVSEGLLFRVQGKGTFVAIKKEKNKFTDVKGFTDAMKEKGVNIRTDILSFEMEVPNELVKNKLGIDDSSINVYKVLRLRYIETEPFALETVYLSESRCKGLTKGMLDNNSLYRVLGEIYNYNIKKAEQIIEPIMLSEEESKILNTEEGSLALKIDRNSYDINNQPIEYTISIFRSDKYQYELALGK